MSEIQISSDKYRIVKSNKLVNSRQPFSALQQRMILMLASRVSPDDRELRAHEFHVAEFFNGSLGGGNYNSIKKSLKELLESSVQIEVETEGGLYEWEGFNLISRAKYSEKSGVIELAFTPEMKPFFLHLKGNYTSYFLRDVNKFEKAYSIRIYEFCKQYFPKINERDIAIDHLKFLLSIENKYPRWQNFKSRVLEPSVVEINAFSDISIGYETLKKGRSVVGIKFKIEGNPNHKGAENLRGLPESSVVQSLVIENKNKIELFSELPSWIDDKNYQKLVGKYSEKVVDYSINKIVNKEDSIDKPRAYLMKGLREGWFAEELEEEQRDVAKTKKKRNEKEKVRQEKNRQEEIVKEFDQQRNHRMINWIAELSEESIEDYIFDFEDSGDSFLKKVAQRLARGDRKEMDMKKVVVWKVEEDEHSTEEDLIFARAEVKKYAWKKYQHTWQE